MIPGFSPSTMKIFKEKTGAECKEDYFGEDIREVRIKESSKKSDFSKYFIGLPEEAKVDEWGVAGIQGSVEHFIEEIPPMKNFTITKELLNYPFPDITADYRYEHLKKDVKVFQDRGLAVMGYGGGVFERAKSLRGMENLLMDCMVNKDFTELLLNIITEICSVESAKVAESGVDVLILASDVGMQDRMLMNPAMWREWLKPRLADVIKSARRLRKDIIVFYHSDGYIEPIIPDLIEIGVDVLNPIQPECMDPAKIKKKYGRNLSFWGRY